MSIIDFDYLKVTTMTVVMPLKGHVDLGTVFPLLEITRLDLPTPKRQTHKYKIPFCGIPGAILSAKYSNITRGIVKSQSKGYFRNSITIDMSTSEKNVNLKLSRNKIQMCGATSVELAMEAGSLIIAELYKIQDTLDYMGENPELTDAAISWLKTATKGNEAQLPPGYIGADQKEPINIHLLHIPDEISPTVDERITMFLIKQAPDFMFHEDYVAQLDWVKSLKTVINKPLEVIEVQKVMVNFNYDLGFDVNRWELYRHINGRNGFKARYDNTVDHSVTIELPYEVPAHMRITRRKDKIPCHIFIVYKSGLVTQSGPNEELMRTAYNLFNSTINEIRSLIIKEGIKRKLKIVPYRKTMNRPSIKLNVATSSGTGTNEAAVPETAVPA